MWTAKNSRGQLLVPRDGDAFPWRAGANECTTFEVSSAGKYGLFMIVRDGMWTVIFNSNHEQWGSRGHDESKDVLQIEVPLQTGPFSESLQFGFDKAQANSAQAYLSWSEVKIPFEVSVPAMEK